MKRFFIALPALIISITLTAQNNTNYLRKFDETLTPSPSVQNMGSFGGVGVNKNTGAINKNIELFSYNIGSLPYTASLLYHSTGLQIDNWGSRVGIGWSENTGAVIQRVVRGIPDESASSRAPDSDTLFQGVTNTNISSSDMALVNNMSVSNTSVDGEYDLFTYNLFGKTGEFIIKNNAAVLLKPDDNLKIKILSSSQYGFIITDPNGVKYYFDQVSETTKFSQENACSIDYQNNLGFVKTGWFISKLVSPGGEQLLFGYTDAQFQYIYDYTESYFYTSYNNRPLPCSVEGVPGEEDQTFDGYNHSKTACLRRKEVNTKILSTVNGENFSVVYSYLNRTDINGEKLLSGITISNNAEVIRSVDLYYNTFRATQAIEAEINNNLDNQDTTELHGIRTRYFLASVVIRGNTDEEMTYDFSYQNPSVLPHRFSFSKDHLGCYNAKQNANLVPVEAIKGIESLGISIPFADRGSTMDGTAGLLNKITYPTGGTDTIMYELNKYTVHETTDHWDWYADSVVCTDIAGTYEQDDFFLMTVPDELRRDAILTLRCYYSSSPLPHPDAEYFATVELVKVENNVSEIIPLPNQYGRLELFPHRDTNWAKYQGVLHFPDTGPGVSYMLKVSLAGVNTALEARFDFIYDTTIQRLTKDFMGYRVKEVITSSNAGSNLYKKYDYNYFNVSNGKVSLEADSSSLNVRIPKKFRASAVNICIGWACPGTMGAPGCYPTNIYPYETYRLLPSDNFDINVYNGLPYAYTHITEFEDTAKTSFIASVYNISPNGHAGWISDAYQYVTAVFPTLENFACDNGLETNRYVGAKKGNENIVFSESKWHHSFTFNKYYNFSSGRIIPPSQYGSQGLGDFIINYYQTYSNWLRLDSLLEKNYSWNADYTSFNSIANKTSYVYNSSNKQVEKAKRYNSKGQEILEEISYPHTMVANSLDPTGIYQEMIDSNLVASKIEIRELKNQNQISYTKISQSKPFTGVFVPDSIKMQTVSTNPLKLRKTFNKYTAKGNLLEEQNTNDVPITYLWGYKEQYVVAKVVGANFSTINSQVDTALLNNGTEMQIRNELDSLVALYSSNAAVQINTYTYKPRVGRIRETDPSGKIIYYQYDGIGRLKAIADQDGKVVKTFEYNYQADNDQ